MAEYTNLTSLAGLQVGDVVIYNTNDTEIDLAGYKVKFEVIGNNSDSAYGGYSCGTLTNASTDFVVFNKTYSACFYKVTDTVTVTTNPWLYKRFIVAGNCGYTNASGSGKGGNGGGLSGAAATPSSSGGKGGKQTAGGAGGTGYSSKYTGGTGSFGLAGSGKKYNNSNYSSGGGPGWYGGGGGGASSYSGSGGGGSGYVLTETSSKPTGYMTDYDTLLLSETTLTTGGAAQAYQTYGSYDIGVITIIESPSSGSTISEIQYYKDGTFIPSNVNYYTNSEFKTCDVYYHNGTEFIKI